MSFPADDHHDDIPKYLFPEVGIAKRHSNMSFRKWMSAYLTGMHRFYDLLFNVIATSAALRSWLSLANQPANLPTKQTNHCRYRPPLTSTIC